jgi:2-oxoglutarate dehydrogenase E2 component (dihydrolipoamide succinyltransferase)
MRIEVHVPQLPESVQDATVLEWRKQAGSLVSKGDVLVELETDKVVLEVPAPDSGVLEGVVVTKGSVVQSGQVLAVLDTESSIAAVPASQHTAQLDGKAITEAAPVVRQAVSPAVSPAVRRLLNEHGLEAAQIGTNNGRLTKQDVLDYLARQQVRPPAAVASAMPESLPQAVSSVVGDGRIERRVPMTRLRSRIAERMMQSQHATATLTTFNEVNLQKIFDLRNAYKAKFEKDHKVKLGFMSFFVKATVEALRRYPVVNASIDGDDVVYHDYYDIGIAVSTDRGLVVPILRDADKLDFGAIERAVQDFGLRARDSKLSYEELTGGTFSITNGGIFGSMLSTPILNPPQSAILGMHAIKERPVVENGEIVIRPIIYLALSYDHRLIDGRDAVSFLVTIKELLEDPVRMVLSI